MQQRVYEINRKVEDFVNKGVEGDSPFKLQNTLKSHQRLQNLLAEMEYTLQKDIPDKTKLAKLTSIEKEVDSICDAKR